MFHLYFSCVSGDSILLGYGLKDIDQWSFDSDYLFEIGI
jgi:hypothetical protein